METLKLEKILNQREQMPRRQRALCEYLLQNTNEADGLTAKQLAQKSGVGEATMFRFLEEQGISVRYTAGLVRITCGAPEENWAVLGEMASYFAAAPAAEEGR